MNMEKPKSTKVSGWRAALGAIGVAAVGAGVVHEIESAGNRQSHEIHAVEALRQGVETTGRLISISDVEPMVQTYDDEAGVTRERTVPVRYVVVEINGEEVRGRLHADMLQDGDYESQQPVTVRYSEFPDPSNPGKVSISIESVNSLTQGS
ncbi:MAG TPA: hypothetical protein VEB18_02980 [Candidatus Paceibacterota bacterium]|nr:hypothetical protein [Candidatus Paceibacterota bacterium]